MKFRPRERLDFENIVQEFDQFKGTPTNMLDFVRLFDRVEVASHLFDATPSRPNDVIERGKILDKETFSGGGVGLIAAIRHRLSATGLVEREMDIQPESFQKLQCGNSDLWKDHVDIAGNEETNS
ncbi:MAG TPA: hypothetical protein VGI45_34325 [Terracidiphilus sp.]